MRANEIKIGRVYTAKVSGKTVNVRVDDIKERLTFSGKRQTTYYVTNLTTNRKLQFKSAAKFRSEVIEKGKLNHLGGNVYDRENEDGSIDIIF